jgi:RNA polymerase sigma factor (sigma-70 family)
MAHQTMNATLGQIRKLLAAQPGGQETDQHLLQRFVTLREEAAFAALVERHGRMVFSVCRSMLHHTQDAEDVCQATFLILARKAVSIRKATSLAHWLHGVACRLALKVKSQRNRIVDRRTPDRPQPPSLMDELTGRELQQILHEELNRLPESYRLPLILCYLEGQTQDETARQLGWSAATLKGRVDRGRNLLRRRLLRRGLALGLPLLVASLAEGAMAELPACLPNVMAQAAQRFLAGLPTGGKMSGQAVALAEGWTQAMLTWQLKLGATLVLLFAMLGAGAGLAAYQAQQVHSPNAQQNENPKTPTAPSKQPVTPIAEKQERKDGRGDPLPEAASLRFGSAHMRHGGTIWASKLSPDGKFLATAGDHSVIVWDLATSQAKHRFPCDQGSTFVWPGLAFSSDGKRLGYVRSILFACVWDLQTEKELRRFERRFEEGLGKFWVGRCQFVNDSKELILPSGDAIETWNVESGQMTTSVPVKSTRLLSADGKLYLQGESKGVVNLGDVRTGKEIARLEVETNYTGMAFSPDGKTVALVHQDREVQLHKTAGGKVMASFPLPASAEIKLTGSNEKYYEYHIAFSSDGNTLLMGTGGGLIHRWDVATNKELTPLSKHYCVVAGMHSLPDGRTLISTGRDGVIRRWDLKTGREEVEPESYEGRSCAAYSLDGRFAAIGDTRGRLDLWDGQSGKLIRTLQQEGAAVTHLAFAPDGKLLAAGERSGTVRFWQVPSGRVEMAWQRKPERGEWYLDGLLFSPDGRLLYLSDYPKQIRVVEVASGKLIWKGENSYSAAFSPDGTTLLVAAPAGPHLTLLDATTGTKRSTVRLTSKIPDGLGVISPVAFSPDGRHLAVALGGYSLMLCDGHTGAETQCLTDHDFPERDIEILFKGGKRPNQVGALAFSPDSKWFVSAGSDREVYLWETATGKEVLRLPGHEAKVSTVAFNPDGRTVFSYGEDGQGYRWDLKPKSAPGRRPTLNELWTNLAETDAGKAYQAVWALSADPQAVDFLRKKLPAAVPPDKTRLAKLIAALNNDDFEIRDTASKALAELAEQATPALEEARKTSSALEQRKRLDELLSSLKDRLSPVQLMRLRAVQALELADTEEARKALKDWAGGDPAALLTQDAKAALARFEKTKR